MKPRQRWGFVNGEHHDAEEDAILDRIDSERGKNEPVLFGVVKPKKYLGSPCAYGHMERYVANGACVECTKQQASQAYKASKRKRAQR